MRNNKGQFVKGQPTGFEKNLELGRGWNKGTHLTNSGSFTKGHKLIGKGIGEIVKGKPSYMKGKHHTEESKEKNRIAHLGKVTMSGEKHYNWKGGITPERTKVYFSKEYKNWRKSVFERDGYTCQICNKKGVILNADHIKPWSLFPDLRYELNNGRTLCISCHRKTHTWGIRNMESYQSVGQNI